MSDRILDEAKLRFHQCQTWESHARNNWKADMRFCYGDSTNLYQWNSDTIDSRTAAGKPCFTVNRTRNYVYQICNDAMQNKSEVQVRAVGGDATFKAAECLEGIVRHIQYISDSSLAYEKATHDQVISGIGYWRIVTDYADDNSFDQEIFIRQVRDALSVYMDPFIQSSDGSDARFAFVFTDLDRNEFRKLYPRYKDAVSDVPISLDDQEHDSWSSESRIRICEYFRKVFRSDTIHQTDLGIVRGSDMEDQDRDAIAANEAIPQRDVQVAEVEWYLIAGDKIIDKGIFPSKYIPIVRCVGMETVIDGVMDRVGHVRSLIDPQRAYNYHTSAGIEFVSGQSKSPWLADVASIEGMEEYWRDANLKNYSVLPYKGRGDDGMEIQPPQRADPPVYAAAFLDGLKVAASEMELVSGQPPAAMGEESNERSGKGIIERQRSAALSTYHFVNNLSNALRFTGKILIDMIPRVYDTNRTMKVLAQDGTMQTIQIDPNQQQAHQDVPGIDEESLDPSQVAQILNPSIGQYDVVAEVGPQFTTRREQFVSATMDLMAQNESLGPIIGDLVFRAMDFPGAQEIANRLKRMVPPQALGIVDPQVIQLQQQIQQQQQIMETMAKELQVAQWKAESIAMQKDIDYYKAETERFKAAGAIDPAAIKPIIREMVSELLNQPVNEVIGMHMAEDAAMMRHAQQVDQQLAQAMGQATQSEGQAPEAPEPATPPGAA